MKKIMVVWIFIMIILVGGLTFIGFHKANTQGVYRELEKKIVTAAESYFEMNPNRLPNAGSLSITSERLIYEGFLDNLYHEGECIGYVIVTIRIRSHNFNGYIKCDNYTTHGFNENYLEEGR